ncbi:hypothetical protein V5799_025108 [Amblyomma americanum]|uniref:BHLH domain-containing protein n=2 Tax=Amblyomma americanum TaxID=6943 RepID=A0AAQ4EA74_AMBAM
MDSQQQLLYIDQFGAAHVLQPLGKTGAEGPGTAAMDPTFDVVYEADTVYLNLDGVDDTTTSTSHEQGTSPEASSASSAEVPEDRRARHNDVERKRRARIKSACDTLRTLVPSLDRSTDAATVFESTVLHIKHLQQGMSHEELLKTSKEFFETHCLYAEKYSEC